MSFIVFESVRKVFQGTSFNCRFHLVNVVVFVYGESLMPFSSYEKHPQISIIRWYSVVQLFCRFFLMLSFARHNIWSFKTLRLKGVLIVEEDDFLSLKPVY